MTGTRKPLLIVEDDPALQKQMQWAFDQYETIVANDRASAPVVPASSDSHWIGLTVSPRVT